MNSPLNWDGTQPYPPMGPPQYPGQIQPLGQRRKFRRAWLALAIVAVVGGVVAVTLFVATPDSARQHSSASEAIPPGPTELHFGTLRAPQGVAVDSLGNVYVTETGSDVAGNGVLKLPADGDKVSRLPFSGAGPTSLAVDSNGDLFATDYVNDRVFTLASSAGQASELPIAGLNRPGGVAVDASGNLLVADTYNDRVLLIRKGGDTVELPFTSLRKPTGVAVDTPGNVYVADTYNDRVVKLPVGASEPVEMPFNRLRRPSGIAVDSAGTVYATSYADGRVVKLAAGQTHSDDLPFTGLNKPWGVAVDNEGSIYVADYGNDRVLSLKLSSG